MYTLERRCVIRDESCSGSGQLDSPSPLWFYWPGALFLKGEMNISDGLAQRHGLSIRMSSSTVLIRELGWSSMPNKVHCECKLEPRGTFFRKVTTGWKFLQLNIHCFGQAIIKDIRTFWNLESIDFKKFVASNLNNCICHMSFPSDSTHRSLLK